VTYTLVATGGRFLLTITPWKLKTTSSASASASTSPDLTIFQLLGLSVSRIRMPSSWYRDCQCFGKIEQAFEFHLVAVYKLRRISFLPFFGMGVKR
jgi:hypothetical protein